MANVNRLTKGEAQVGKIFTDTSVVFPDKTNIFSYLDPIYGQLSRITAGTVNSVTQSVYRDTNEVTANYDAENSNGLVAGTANPFSLKNNTNESRLLKFYATADVKTVSGNNKILGIKLAKNGIPLDETECQAFTGNDNSGAKLFTSWMIRLEPNDEVAVFLTSHSADDDIVIDRGKILANGVFRQSDLP